MDIASQLLSCACQSAAQPICQQLNYIRKHRQNEETMQSEWETLRCQKDDICENLEIGKVRHGKKPKNTLMLWLKKVEEIEERVNSLGSGDANHMCFKGVCPNYYSRLKRSKKTMEIYREVKVLQEDGKSFAKEEDLFLDSPAETSSCLLATTLHGTSAEKKKEEILQAIMDPEASKIGVYGMGGVGKTTIMTQIFNELNEKKVFDIVIWVTVSSSFNEKELQDKVAGSLQCQLPSSDDLMSKARVLHEAFRRRKNFAIIFDDIWGRVSLQNVGIPEPNRSNGSKVVWTTRFMEVCHNMESNREIQIEGLTDEEAWSLFKDKLGVENVIMSTEIQPIAKQVVKECGRLPLALITVGCALRKADQPQVWRNALQLLRTSRADKIPGMARKVLGSLKFSYDSLSNDTTRSCFLYCALYPEDHEIFVDELIKYWMAEGLINEMGSMQIDIDKGHAYLKELKDACMIESVRNDGRHVKMHDLVRDLAIDITRKEPRFMVKAGLQLTESPEEEEWVESLQRVSLMRNKIKSFGGQPNCPRLSTLLLQFNGDLVNFSDTFFKHMHNLRVLNLSYSGIISLPNSISNLVNLQALILKQCVNLNRLPSLARLQKLRLLDLSELIYLKELPHGLENLVKLRHLNISSGNLGSFPSGALLNMPCLEILYMNDNWQILYPLVKEIISLKKLTILIAEFADVLAFNSYINGVHEFDLLKNFDYFKIRVNHKYVEHKVENESVEKVRLPGTEICVEIVGCNFIHLLDIFEADDLRQLIECRVEMCYGMKWIGRGGDQIVLPSIKSLFLLELHNFKGLCKEKPHEETFKSLTNLYVEFCHKLKYLIPIDLLVNNLQNLEIISIEECGEMEEIISGQAEADMAILPKLKKLRLEDLPRLTSIYQGKLVCDSLYDIILMCCTKLEKLPFLINNKSSVSAVIIGSQEWWETMAWEDPQLKEHLQSFFEHSSDESNADEPDHTNESDTHGETILRIEKFKDSYLGYDWYPDAYEI